MDELKEILRSFNPSASESAIDRLAERITREQNRGGRGERGDDTGFFRDTAQNIGATAKTINEAMTQALEPLQRINTGFQTLVERTRGLTKATQDYLAEGFTGQMFDFSNAIDAANRASILFNGNATAGGKINRAWAESTKVLAFTNVEFQKSLMEQSVVLERAGFDVSKFAEIVDSAALAFNSNEQEINSLTSTLINVQREIPVSGRELAQNFRRAQQDFAYSADQMMDNFIGLQKMSTTTGISFDRLTSAFGTKLDTFQGSAQMAGQLNQILGKSAFNSMELLTMTETERATRVRGAILESGRSIEDMGKFEILALQKSLGLGSVEETRRFLRGDLNISDDGDAMARIEAADPNTIKSRQLGDTMDFLVSSINKTRTPLETMRLQALRFAVELEEKAVKGLTKFTESLAESGASIPTIVQAQVAAATGQVVLDPQTGMAISDPTALAGVVTKTNNMIATLAQITKEQLANPNAVVSVAAAEIAKGIQNNIGTLTFGKEAVKQLGEALNIKVTVFTDKGEVIIGPGD